MVQTVQSEFLWRVEKLSLGRKLWGEETGRRRQANNHNFLFQVFFFLKKNLSFRYLSVKKMNLTRCDGYAHP